MRSVYQIIATTFSILLFSSCEPAKFTDNKESDIEDPAFNAKIDSAWSEVRKYWELRSEDKVAEADDPQNAFAQEFFQYYLAHPRTKTGRQALSSAFVMWGNIGEIDQVKKAIPQIDIHADVWSPILSGIGNAFSKNNQGDEFIALLHDFESKLTHPASKTAVFNRLGDYYLGKDDGGRAKDFFQRIVSLDADSFYVERATGNLYELESLNIGQIAPDFSATDLDGNKITLSELRGKVVLLDFWATWCGPCLPEIPYLKNIYSENKNEDFVIIGISLDRNLEELHQFIEKEKIGWPQILDEKKWEGEIVKLYNVNSIPSTYLIDGQGIIAAKNLRKQELKNAVSETLKSSRNQISI